MLTISPHRQIPFIRNQRYLIALSIILTIASLVAVWRIGINFGIDFKGGIKLTVRTAQETTDGAVADALAASGTAEAVQQLGRAADHRFLVTLRQADAEGTATVAAATQALQEKFGAEGVTVEGQEIVGPRVGKELMRKGEAAIIFTLLAILIYIGFRFDFYFAPGAIVALIHDVVIALGAVVIARREYDLTSLAAFLTIVGYSVNDTIIIYDRIREHGREITPATIREVVNRALNDTLSRTIVTSLVVLFVVVTLFLTTQGAIQTFAYAFIFGVIAGTYSSIFIASPIYIWLYERFPQWRKAS